MAIKRKTVIVLAGPTAVGKTAAGIAVAKHFGTEIISADSRQCFRELAIGVARPSPEELAQVPHHFIASHTIQEGVNAATFEQYALERTAAIFEKSDVAVMVGGTGLYIKAFCEGLDAIPEVPASIREAIIHQYERKGLAWLQGEVAANDPAFFAGGEIHNPQRLMRALEVVKATGNSILYYRSGKKAVRDFSVIKIALELPRAVLYDRINRRVEEMLRAGLLQEVEGLMPFQHLNALQTVGYKELFAHFNGEQSLEQSVEQIKANTRHYAKRQLTWFKKDEAYQWWNAEKDGKELASFIDSSLTLPS